MSQTNNDKNLKPIVDKSALQKSIKDKQKAIKQNQIIKK